MDDMAQKCSLLTPLATALSTTKSVTFKIQYSDCLKPIQTNAGQTPEGPEVLVGSDKLQRTSKCFDDYQKLLDLLGCAGKLERNCFPLRFLLLPALGQMCLWKGLSSEDEQRITKN